MANTKKVKERVNWPITILLIIGLITIIFPLYMAVVIAFKDPSEMTNDIAGILSLPSTWSLDNFIEAIQVTDFFRSFMNSLIITVVAVVVSILIHSLAAYAIAATWITSASLSGRITSSSPVCTCRSRSS